MMGGRGWNNYHMGYTLAYYFDLIVAPVILLATFAFVYTRNQSSYLFVFPAVVPFSVLISLLVLRPLASDSRRRIDWLCGDVPLQIAHTQVEEAVRGLRLNYIVLDDVRRGPLPAFQYDYLFMIQEKGMEVRIQNLPAKRMRISVKYAHDEDETFARHLCSTISNLVNASLLAAPQS